MQTDLAISASGDAWVMNNWQDTDSCYSSGQLRRSGPICGARTGLATPKKITTPWPPQRVESARCRQLLNDLDDLGVLDITIVMYSATACGADLMRWSRKGRTK